MSGELLIVATPIGNLKDLSERAVHALTSASVVACEDTRRTQKLLSHLSLHPQMIRYDEHIHQNATPKILDVLRNGKIVALVSDAGTPGISDPGSRLVRMVAEAGFKVTPIPGPCSAVAALSASGFYGDQFVFLGFLPRKEGPAKRLLRGAFGLGRTTILLESPYRAQKTLGWVADLNPEIQVVIAREMTKIHEEFMRGKAKELSQRIQGKPMIGEVILLIENE